MTDQELLDCFLGGDTECFSIVYNRFQQPFIKTAMYQYSLVKEDAEDLVQDFFLKSFENFNRYDASRGTIKDFMEGSFKNFAIDFIRKEKRKGYQEEIEEHHAIEDEMDEMVEYRNQLYKYIDQVVQEEPYRTIFDKYLSGTDMRDLYTEFGDVIPPFKLKNFITNSLVSIRKYATKK